MLLEPWGGSICNSIERVHALLDAVPGLRLLVDTGHVATWGEDPAELLPWADHVQLRQASEGDAQRHPDEGGDVDFAAIFRRLDDLDYGGLLSIEYFNLPDYGWPLDDPVGHAVALAEQVRPMLR
jgi:sugar phosphate isomerase/epimerase